MSESVRQVTFIPGENAPVSPHLQVWKFTWTMAASISQRISGVGNAIGMLLLTAWITSAAISESAFDAVSGFLGSPIGIVLLAGFTASVMFHMLNGLRYLAMDSGKVISKEAGNVTSALAYIGAVVLTAAILFAGFSFAGGAN
ncbi:succinate dehydrogenase, cytochrome b556 subunit [Parvularcula sp. ZS-1/3]|uniref:Succinate dehydrogenase cytochrome b556 subunit n=1 Tax=Parvularcula mediterranea TaxID=2732508 RepID=A0A7Y3RL75_9PROT|nr:succinate dehydrogenase, cytochrome b556 subunit [Parvularcula mediterranea]NNU15630.1 succinate dehydrogenase, cytochrome b556 subunit [Parvularcula mediterranea]